MIYPACLLTIYLLVLQRARLGQATREPVAGVNAEPYYLLCNIYNVASNPPQTLYDPIEIDKIREEVDVIQAALADEAWFSEIKRADGHEKLSESFKAQNEEYKKFFGRWKKAVTKVGEGNGFIQRLPIDTAIRKLPYTKLRSIEGQVEKIVKNMEKLNESAKLDEIRKNFDAAIGESECDKSPTNCGITGNRGATNCGKVDGTAGSGTAPSKSGSNLIVDFLCLCAKAGSGSQKATGNECIDATAATGSMAWHSAGPLSAGAKDFWTALKTGCSKHSPTHSKSTSQEARGAISKFLTALGSVKRHASSDAKGCGIGVLGVFYTTDGSCNQACQGDMGSDNNGICVAYGKTPKGWAEGIAWLNQLKGGLALLEGAENKTISIRQDIAHLKMLQTRAQEIYEEAKATFELTKANPENTADNQTKRHNPTTPPDKATIQQPNTVSAATKQRLILLWTLLI